MWVDALGGFCYHLVHLHPIPALGPGQSLPEQSLCLLAASQLVELELPEHVHGDTVFLQGSWVGTSSPQPDSVLPKPVIYVILPKS